MYQVQQRRPSIIACSIFLSDHDFFPSVRRSPQRAVAQIPTSASYTYILKTRLEEHVLRQGFCATGLHAGDLDSHLRTALYLGLTTVMCG